MEVNGDAHAAADRVQAVIDRFGGRFSSQVGIDVDDGDGEIERWFLASTLFGNRVDSGIALRTYRVLDAMGLSTIGDVTGCGRDRLVGLLDRGGYVRHDYRMSSRLLALAEHADDLLPDGVCAIGTACDDPERLRARLESLPGWGPTTTRAFLRELRGTWPGADLPVDPLAASAARHLGLVGTDDGFDLVTLTTLARQAGVDVRDLEAALVRVALAHHRSFDTCETRSPGACRLLTERDAERLPEPRSGGRRVVRIDSRLGSFPRSLP